MYICIYQLLPLLLIPLGPLLLIASWAPYSTTYCLVMALDCGVTLPRMENGRYVSSLDALSWTLKLIWVIGNRPQAICIYMYIYI